jgi:hypothetical protein
MAKSKLLKATLINPKIACAAKLPGMISPPINWQRCWKINGKPAAKPLGEP